MMKEYLKRLPKELQDLISLASNVASGQDEAAYLVGGFVRDLIVGVENLDLDIVIEGNGIAFAQDFAQRLNAKLTVHRRFGTATVIINHRLKIDIASCRKESYPYPGSLPVVSRGSLKDDLLRRDFTINAMAIGISGDNFGKLIDFFHGKDDIQRRQIRILHALSFIDDPTRILRAIRFEQRYKFHIESHTLKLLKKALASSALEKISCHRLRDELILLLKEPQPIKYIRRINKLIGFSFLSPDFHFSKRTEAFLKAIAAQINWFKNYTPRKRMLDVWLIYLIGLIGYLSVNRIKALCTAFGFSKGEVKRILSYKKTIVVLGNKLRRSLPPSRVYKYLEPLSYEVILLLNAKYRDKALRQNIADFFNIYNGVRIQATGNDLAGLAIAPGPRYKDILTRILYAKLDGKIKTKAQELEFIKRLAKR